MGHNRSDRTNNRPRWGGSAAIGLGAAAGALLAAAMATAPTARADALTDILTNVQSDISAGQGLLAAGVTDLAKGDVPDFLNQTINGLNDVVLVSPEVDVILGLLDAATGNPVSPPLFFAPDPTPTNLTLTLSDVEVEFTNGESAFVTALSNLISGDLADGFQNTALGIATFVEGQEDALIGATDILLGVWTAAFLGVSSELA